MVMQETLLTIFVSVFASTGFWAFVSALVQKRDESKNARDKLLMGLARNQIIKDCEIYLARGYISIDDHNDLHKYFYNPYKSLGGNGTVEKIVKEVDKLPIKEV